MSWLPNDRFFISCWDWRTLTIMSAVALGIPMMSRWFLPKNRLGKKKPPVAPLGVLETVRAMTSSQAPWHFTKIARQLKSNVFRLNLPIMPGGVYMSGNGQLNRQILMDCGPLKPRIFYHVLDPIGGSVNMMTNSGDQHWKHMRRCIAPAFSPKEVHRMSQICQNLVEEWILKTLEPKIAAKEAFDPTLEFMHLIFRVICEAAFEYQPSQNEIEEFVSNLDLAMREFMIKRMTIPFRGIFGMFLPQVLQAQKSCRLVQAFGRKILQAYRTNPLKSDGSTVIRLLVENTQLSSDRDRVAEIVVLLLAGHGTGHTLGNLFLHLCQHPVIQAKLRSEISQANGPASCPYLRNVIRESSRLLPVVPVVSVRQAPQMYLIGDDYCIPKGAYVLLNYMLSSHDEAVFPNPKRFDPERWDDASVTPTMLESYMPFSLGDRKCLGQALAISQLNTVIPQLLLKYDFQLVESGYLEYFITIKTVGTRIKAGRL